MDRFLKYFQDPIRRVELSEKVGQKQANQVITHLLQTGDISHFQQRFSLTEKGKAAWEKYVGVVK